MAHKWLEDEGYIATEEELERLEAEIHAIFHNAAIDAEITARKYLETFLAADEEMRKKVINGEITQSDYINWRRTKILTAERYREMANTISIDLLQYKMVASSIINGHLPEIYAININYLTYRIEHGARIDTSFTLYNHFAVERIFRDNPNLLPFTRINPLDSVAWDKKSINSVIAQSIIKGDSIDEIAASLQRVAEMDEKQAIRNARTATTSAQNAGRLDAMKRVQGMGATVEKMWIATLDGRTRHAHIALDGQTQPLDKPFDSEYGEIMYPGDPSADPANVYNCRCSLINQDVRFPVDASDLSLRYDDNLGGMTYDEWKHSKDNEARFDNPAY